MTLANALSSQTARIGPSASAAGISQRVKVITAAYRFKLSSNTKYSKLSGGRVTYSASRAAVVCIAQVEEAAPNVETLSDTNGSEPVGHRPLESTTSAEQEAPSPSSSESEEAGSHEASQRETSNRRGRGKDNRTHRKGGRGAGRAPRDLALTAQDPRRAPCTEHNLKRGDIVAGRVIRSTQKGCNIELLEDPRIVGFAPISEGPFCMKDRVTSQQGGLLMPMGLVREFRVKAVPEDMEYYGKGPLLSAKDLDLDVLWKRADQIKLVCDEDLECVTVKVTDANSGGMLATIESLPGFIPYSLMEKPKDGAWLSHEEMQDQFIGKDVQVCIKDVSPDSRKVVLNMQQAASNQVLKSMQVGNLVWGTVRRVETYGVFVGVDGTRFSGLLHISCISKAHVEAVEDIFAVGDRVRAMLVGMEQNFSRISLSTAELESTPGDMLYPNSRPAVYENAEEMAEESLKKMQQREEDDRFYGNNSDRDQGFDFDDRR